MATYKITIDETTREGKELLSMLRSSGVVSVQKETETRSVHEPIEVYITPKLDEDIPKACISIGDSASQAFRHLGELYDTDFYNKYTL